MNAFWMRSVGRIVCISYLYGRRNARMFPFLWNRSIGLGAFSHHPHKLRKGMGGLRVHVVLGIRV